MNFVIPMAGRSQRFKDAGYTVPKMLIEAHGKTLMEWSIDSLPLELCTNMICVMLKEHEQEFFLSEKIRALYSHRFNICFHYLDTVTRGQAETVSKALHLLDHAKDLLIFNIDTYFFSATLSGALQRGDIDGVLGSFLSSDKRFSFARTNDNGNVEETAEKSAISRHALTGLYHFKKVSDFLEAVEYYVSNDIRVNGEFFVAPMYNYLIAKGKRYILDEADRHYILGTPAELSHFIKGAT